jgi:hypothetical protein
MMRRAALEHFPLKWYPLERQKMRPNKELEPLSDAIRTEKALEHFPIKQLLLERQKMRPCPSYFYNAVEKM